MADFRCTAASQCAGQGHVILTATVNGVSRTKSYAKADLLVDPPDLEEAILARWRSAVKEAGATTLAQMSAAILNKDFKV